jgi:hypothetical protein
MWGTLTGGAFQPSSRSVAPLVSVATSSTPCQCAPQWFDRSGPPHLAAFASTNNKHRRCNQKKKPVNSQMESKKSIFSKIIRAMIGLDNTLGDLFGRHFVPLNPFQRQTSKNIHNNVVRH